jgi:outer membrane protein assembly factor BamA
VTGAGLAALTASLALAVARGTPADPGEVRRPHAALVAQGPAAEADAAGEAPVVASVRLELPPGEAAGGLQAFISVEPGARLSRRALRRTVQLLYGTGRFANVVAEASPVSGAPGRVELVLRCLPRRSLASLRIVNRDSPRALDDDRVRRTAGLAPGDELWPGRLDDAAARVRAALTRRGYPRAQVRATAEGDGQVAAQLVVEQGTPTRVAAFTVAAPAASGPERLADGLATRVGAPLDLDALEADLRTLRDRLRGLGYLRARVGAPTVAVEGERARIEVPVDAGPHVGVRFPGATAFTASELRAQANIEAEQALDAPAIQAAADRVRAHYLAHGYAAARVWGGETSARGGVTLAFHVEEGRRYHVRSVTFSPAPQREAAWLRARLDEALEQVGTHDDGGPAAEAALLARASGSPAQLRSRAPVDPREVWNPPVWDEAVGRIVEVYRAEGFLDATHEGTRVTLDTRAGVADVEIRLREGVRTLVEAVVFEGQRAVELPLLVKASRLAPGDPLAFAEVEATRAAVLGVYARRGHVYARVTDAEELSSDRARAVVRFRIDEGPQVRVRSIVVSGAQRTRDDIVRETLALRPGDVYDPDAASRSQTALLRLGVFRSVGLRLADADVPDTVKDVDVQLSERPWQTLAPGIGFSLANGPRAFVEYARPNLFGRALELSMRAKVNYPLATLRADSADLERKAPLDRFEGRAEVGLHDPRVRWLGLPMGARVDGIVERLHRLAYDLSRASVVFGVDVPVGPRITLSLQYELEVDHIIKRSQTLTLTFADLERLRFGEGVTTLQSVRPVLAVDYRDNPVHPRRGWLATAVADYAHSIGSSNQSMLFGLVHGSDVFTHMLKLSGTLTTYLPVGADSVFALSLRGGRVLPLDAASQTIGPKRFFLGGAATMRGYGEDEMVPEDVRSEYAREVAACASSLSGLACSPVARQLAQGQTLVSPGGESFVLWKGELRIPLRESIEAGLFADVGNVWLDPRLTSLTDVRVNFGLGLRFLTPIGPASLDLGVNPKPDGRLGERYLAPHFSIGLF